MTFLIFQLEDAGAQTSKPNVILILGDDVGYNTIGCNGGTQYSTPNLDSMAQHGVRFTQCYSSPLCSPSRHTLLTGKYNFRNYKQWGAMDVKEKTIANVFKESGYKTACYGKWQLDGGDKSLKAFGFDNYCVWLPYQRQAIASRYKNPVIYQHGNFVPDSVTVNQYGEDIFTDSVLNFIDSNQSGPFFIYYPMVLSHAPFQPTPDDSSYSSWDISQKDTSYYKSMVKYMDKKAGLILNKVRSLGIENNTIILFVGDNGTPTTIIKNTDDDDLNGGKGSIIKSGTNVPLIAYCPQKFPAGTVSGNLVDFTDFIPTLSELAQIPVSGTIAPLDGVSFSSALTGQQGTAREWIFNYYDPKPGKTVPKRWAQTLNYKLVDSLDILFFYNILNDAEELNPIADSLLTAAEVTIKQQLLTVLNGYAVDAPPVLSNSAVKNVTDSSAIISAAITPVGGFTSVSERGFFLSSVEITSLNKNYQNNYVAEGGTAISSFEQTRDGLLPQKKYYFKGYASNNNGGGVSPEVQFYTLSKHVVEPPNAFAADPGKTSVNLTWNNAIFPVSGASNAGYLLIYSLDTPSLVYQLNGLSPREAVGTGAIVINSASQLPLLPRNFVTLRNLEEGTEYHFLLISYTWDGINPSTYNYFVEGAKTITSVTEKTICVPPTVDHVVKNIKCPGTNTGTIIINAAGGSKPYVFSWSGPGSFSSAAQSISNLYKGSYHLTVTAQGGCTVTGDFEITEPELLTFSTIEDSVKCAGGNAQITVKASGGSGGYLYSLSKGSNPLIFVKDSIFNATTGNYTLAVKDALQCSYSSPIVISEPSLLKFSATIDTTMCRGDSVLLTIIASGGSGDYLYSVSKGINTTGPQSSNQFTVSGGQYSVTVQDAKECKTVSSIMISHCTLRDTSIASQDFKIKIFPNPGVSDFILTVTTDDQEKIQFFITDLFGRRLLLSSAIANKEVHFGKNLIPGTYFVTVQHASDKQTFKIIKR